MDEHIVQARHGDHEAFVQLITQYESKLFRTALAITGNRADAEDAWQNTVLNAYRGIRGLREPRFFKTWLTRILLNECKQLLRGRARQPLTVALESDHFQEMGTDRVDLEIALAELSDEQRVVVVLRFWLGLTLAEIAELTMVPEGTAKTRLYQALKRLRVKLEGVL